MKKPQDEFARRRAQRRKKIRRRRILIAAVTFLIVSAAVFAGLALTVLFPVKTVTVSGETRYGAQEIIAASGLSEKSNLFTFSGTRVTERIQKSLPYIGEVKITRQLPDAVQIEICSERTEFACFPAQDGYYAVSEDFVVLARYDERPPQLFTVNCTGAVCEIGSTVAFPDEKTASAVSKLISALSGLEIEINAVTADGSTSLSAAVCGRFLVNFGGAADIERKVAHVGGMVRQIAPDQTGRIDLSMWSASSSQGTFIAGGIDLTKAVDPYAQPPASE